MPTALIVTGVGGSRASVPALARDLQKQGYTVIYARYTDPRDDVQAKANKSDIVVGHSAGGLMVYSLNHRNKVGVNAAVPKEFPTRGMRFVQNQKDWLQLITGRRSNTNLTGHSYKGGL